MELNRNSERIPHILLKPSEDLPAFGVLIRLWRIPSFGAEGFFDKPVGIEVAFDLQAALQLPDCFLSWIYSLKY
jgi:hypothetical protein